MDRGAATSVGLLKLSEKQKGAALKGKTKFTGTGYRWHLIKVREQINAGDDREDERTLLQESGQKRKPAQVTKGFAVTSSCAPRGNLVPGHQRLSHKHIWRHFRSKAGIKVFLWMM